MILWEKQFRRLRLFIVAAAGFCLVVGTVALLRAREAARQSACTNNLKQVWLALQEFAWDHNKFYPRIDDTKGNLIFEGHLIFPEYLRNIEFLGCPADSGYKYGMTFRLKENSNSDGGVADSEAITSESYIYLGWVVTNEEEGLAAIDAYVKLFNGRPKTVPPSTEKEDEKAKPELILTGRELTSFPGKSAESDSLLLEDHLFVTQGTGNLGGDVIHRLTLDSEFYGIPPELRNPEVSYPSMVPIMWEWPDNHSFAGGNVLYLDGHVEFVPYPGNFPMTKNFIEALRKVEPQLPDGVPPIVNK